MKELINVYVVPPGKSQLDGNFFKDSKEGVQATWAFIKEYCEQQGVILDTIDRWQPSARKDVVLVIDHPSQDLLHKTIYSIRLLRHIFLKKPFFKIRYYGFNKFLKKFSKRVLFQFEPPVVMPYVYKNLPRLKKVYNQIYLTIQIEEFNYFHMPQTFNAPVEPFFSNKDRGGIVMMNSNKRPLKFKNELYGERLKAIKYFSEHGGIDLYGAFWDRLIFSPYTLYKKYVKASYKGFVDNKLQAMSKYKFAICFENEIAQGWITEKIFDCFLVGTVPVYYGATNITDYIPANCFIDFRDFKDYDALKEYLDKMTSADLEEYRKNVTAFYKSGKSDVFHRENLAKKIIRAVTNKERPQHA